MKSFAAGTITAAIALFPFALIGLHATIAAAVAEADARSARNIKALMHQVKPGITECLHVSPTEMNCKKVHRGKVSTVVLAIAKE